MNNIIDGLGPEKRTDKDLKKKRVCYRYIVFIKLFFSYKEKGC